MRFCRVIDSLCDFFITGSILTDQFISTLVFIIFYMTTFSTVFFVFNFCFSACFPHILTLYFLFCSFFSTTTDERDAIQKKTFTKWVNKHLIKVSEIFMSVHVNT